MLGLYEVMRVALSSWDENPEEKKGGETLSPPLRDTCVGAVCRTRRGPSAGTESSSTLILDLIQSVARRVRGKCL